MADRLRQQRIRVFDRWVAQTAEVLQLPGVQQALGALGVRLLARNNEAFLPNIRDEIVSIPRNKRSSNGVAILPRLAADLILFPDISLSEPTPARKQKMAEALRAKNQSASTGAVKRLIGEGMQTLTLAEKFSLVNDVETTITSYHTKTIGNGVLYTSRPFMMLNPSSMCLMNRILQGAIGVHELVHVDDSEELVEMPRYEPYRSAKTEMRAYGGSAVVLDHALEAGLLGPEQADEHIPLVAQIEGVRSHYGIERGTLFNGTLEDDAVMDNIAFELMLMGASHLPPELQ